MLPKQSIGWFASIAIVATPIWFNVDAAWADGCGCNSRVVGSPVMGSPYVSSSLPAAHSIWTRPTPVYASSWAKVPVTSYRPQVINDPLSGVGVTSLQPCKTFEWQLRRTPTCSLWQRFVDWWRSNCSLTRAQSTVCAPATYPAVGNCSPSNGWIVSSGEPSASPYYTPSTTRSSDGRLVPAPAGLSPSPPVPADRRPELDPDRLQNNGSGSASRLLRPQSEVFVRTLDRSDASPALVPPLVDPNTTDATAAETRGIKRVPQLLDGADRNRSASSAAAPGMLRPVSWMRPNPIRSIPTDVVWDDTGWKSE